MRQQRISGEMSPLRRYGGEAPACKFAGCGVSAVSRGWCASHYGQWLKGRVPSEIDRTPKPGRRINKWGYIEIRLPVGHHARNTNGWGLEHRAVMGEIVGRELRADETVHHKNGMRGDNRPENLELWISRHPKGQRVEDVVLFAREILALYA